MLPEAFIRGLSEELGPDRARTVLDALSGEPSVSVRLNPAKLTACPFPDAERISWSPYGYLLKERPNFTLDPLFHAGCYYVQDSSAMFVGALFRSALDGFGPGVTVLDLCAAPGGKTTDLAASLRERFGDRFSLLANEVMRNRFGVLRSNVRTWGDPRVGVVSRDPSAFSGKPVFDIIVADVPCSGEGMFRKDEKAVEDWSPETVDFCAARSRRILSDVWSALKPRAASSFSRLAPSTGRRTTGLLLGSLPNWVPTSWTAGTSRPLCGRSMAMPCCRASSPARVSTPPSSASMERRKASVPPMYSPSSRPTCPSRRRTRIPASTWIGKPPSGISTAMPSASRMPPWGS